MLVLYHITADNKMERAHEPSASWKAWTKPDSPVSVLMVEPVAVWWNSPLNRWQDEANLQQQQVWGNEIPFLPVEHSCDETGLTVESKFVLVSVTFAAVAEVLLLA